MLSETIRVGGVPLQVEVAMQPADQARGLSGRGFLGWNQGMIFLYPQDDIRGFWMRNTLIPLSIAFFDSTGTIVHIADMEPGSQEMVMSPVPCRGAIEVNRGWFGSNGIQVGHPVDLGGKPAVARRNESNPETALPESTLLSTVRTVYGITHLVSAPVAMALSYQRNRSLGWAFLTGFVPIPYLVFRYIDRGSEK